MIIAQNSGHMCKSKMLYSCEINNIINNNAYKIRDKLDSSSKNESNLSKEEIETQRIEPIPITSMDSMIGVTQPQKLEIFRYIKKMYVPILIVNGINHHLFNNQISRN
jgi:hypothetical protein